MTLHWWMHWFWVTAQFLVILGSPLPSTTSIPVSQPLPSLGATSTSIETQTIYRTSKSPRPSFRIAKAIGLYPLTNTAVAADRQQLVTTIATPSLERGSTAGASVREAVELNNRDNISSVVPLSTATTPQRTTESVERIRTSTTKKDSKITWILTTNKSSVGSKYDQEERNQSTGAVGRNATFDEVEDLTVLPLQKDMSRDELINRTRSSFASSLSGAVGSAAIRTFNRSEDEVEIDEEVAQTQHFATAASVLEVGVSESTRLSRARNTFITQNFQRDRIHGDNLAADYADTGNNGGHAGQGSGTSAAGIAAITGSCLATVALLSTMGSLGFIIYRRKYLNPPQTLNSDKCSNPDSSGYIDDSTIRDNSEEMYSLDNDSFLNSLEAMTIQNYWTDSVKHTKL